MSVLRKVLVYLSMLSILVLACGCVNTQGNMPIPIKKDVEKPVNKESQNVNKVENKKESQLTQNTQSNKEIKNQENRPIQNNQNYENPQKVDNAQPNKQITQPENQKPEKPQPQKPVEVEPKPKKEIKDPIISINKIDWGNDIIIEDAKAHVRLVIDPIEKLKPEISVGSCKIKSKEDINIRKATLEVDIDIKNPNPIGCVIEELKIDIYGYDGKFLGSGLIRNERLVKYANETISVIVKISNREALKNLVELAKNDEITLSIKGHGIFKYEDGTTKEIPININDYTVELPEILIKLKDVLNNFEEWKEKIYGKLEEYKNLRCVEDKYGVINIYPENPEVGMPVTITVKDPETHKPVKGVWVWEVKNKESMDESLKEEIINDLKEMLKNAYSSSFYVESPLLSPLGKTDENGRVSRVTLITKTGFVTGGNRIILTKVGDTVYYKVIYVKGWKEKIIDKFRDKIKEYENVKWIEDTYGDIISIYPENPKAGDLTIITIKDPETNEPIEGVWVWSGHTPLGKTDKNGQVAHKYLTGGKHTIKVKIADDLVVWRTIYVESIGSQIRKILDKDNEENSNKNNNEYASTLTEKHAVITIYPETPKRFDTITIVVTDEQGNPLEGAEVYIDGDYIGTTDENGQITYRAYKTGLRHVYVEVKRDNIIYKGEKSFEVKTLTGLLD